MEKTFYEKHTKKLAAFAAGLNVGRLVTGKDDCNIITVAIEPEAQPAPRWRITAGHWGMKPEYFQISLAHEKSWGNWSKHICANMNIERPLMDLIADAKRRCIVPGTAYFKKRFKKSAEEEAKRKSELFRLKSIFSELNDLEIEESLKNDNYIRSYKFGFTAHPHFLHGPYEAQIRVESEYAFRQILKIIKEDWEISHPITDAK